MTSILEIRDKFNVIRKSVIGSNIHIEVNEFDSLWIVFWNDSRSFGFSTRSLGHVMFFRAFPAKENITWPRLLIVVNRFKTRSKVSQIHFKFNVVFDVRKNGIQRDTFLVTIQQTLEL